MQAKNSLAGLLAAVAERTGPLECSGVSGAAGAYLTAEWYRRRPQPLLLVLPSPRAAERFHADLSFFLGADPAPAVLFPAYHLLPYKAVAYHSQTAAARLRTLYRLVTGARPPIVVTAVTALMQRVIPKARLTGAVELIMAGEELDRDDLIARLLAGGYEHTAIVEEPGDFCVRGGLLDLFSPLYEHPLRVELFGDTVESVRFFSPVTQRKTGSADEAVVLPARETILTGGNGDALARRLFEAAARQESTVRRLTETADRLRQGAAFPGLDALLPLVYPQPDTLLDYLPQDACPVMVEPSELQRAAEALLEQARTEHAAACAARRFSMPPESHFMTWQQLHAAVRQRHPLVFNELAVARGTEIRIGDAPDSRWAVKVSDNGSLSQALRDGRGTEAPLEPLLEWIARQQRHRRAIVFVGATRSQTERLEALLAHHEVPIRRWDGFPERRQGAVSGVCQGGLSQGFVWPAESLALVTADELFGRRRRARPQPPRPRVSTELLRLGDLRSDDFVVHSEHGIGRYTGLVKLTLDGTTNDFLLIAFRGGDKLYVPVERMNMVSRYMGVEGVAPVLDKMGGRTWERVRSRVKKSVQKIAGDLLKLYAQRRVAPGHAFDPPDGLFREFEAGFPFDETPDQLKAIEAVLADMQRPTPMDRLVCGDVGYGKTEVALRAAFLALSEGRQVAVLVPTTVLAEQHLVTFRSRLDALPVRVECLSRFRPPKRQRRILADLAAGRTDVIIGTHRLLQKDVVFKDLGLLVLDEEQRFGVKHKERLKRLCQNVDVLTLSATPIPRTLHLSLLGIRDISIIATPPEQRRSIMTYVCEFENAVVREAVRKELARGGQIFFVHNTIGGIWRMAAHIRELVPEVRLDVAHGQMPETELEKVMLRFVQHEIDLLVCTTIIESGLDIPAANTIIINRADRFGLAQIYQLRGRVGRSDEQAYAYLFIPRHSALSREAQKRLKVLMEHSDLGSGFQIAMSDLKIRGGGSILGADQSGHIAAVGYDTFLKLMEETIGELQGRPVIPPLVPEINLPLSAFIPESYIADIDQRMWMYRRLARLDDLKALTDVKQELVDRFGPVPAEATNLLFKIMLKILAGHAGVQRLDLAGRRLNLQLAPAHQARPDALAPLAAGHAGVWRLTPDHVLKVRLSTALPVGQLAETKKILKQIGAHVNS